MDLHRRLWEETPEQNEHRPPPDLTRRLTADTINEDGLMLLCERLLRDTADVYVRALAGIEHYQRRAVDPDDMPESIESWYFESPAVLYCGADPVKIILSLRRKAREEREKCKESSQKRRQYRRLVK